MASDTSQQGFVLSLGLHISLAAVVAVLAWTKPFERKRESVFELIPLGTADGDPNVSTQPQSVKFDLPDGPRTEPTPTPPRSSPPTASKPKPTPPKPTNTTPPPTTRATPPPKPTRTPPPAPTPAPAPSKPDRMSYEEFVQQHGKPQQRTTPTTRSPAPTGPRTAPRIDTRFTSTVSSASRGPAGSTSGSPDAERTEVTLYLAALYDAILRAWEKPQGLELTVAVDIDIAPSGRITNVRISKSSGNASYDESALVAVRTVGSAGPTPGGVTLLRTLRFNMKAQ